MRMDRGTDERDEAFRKFANAPKKRGGMKINSQYHHVLSMYEFLSACLSAQNCGNMLNEATYFTEARIKCPAHRDHTTDTECVVGEERTNR